MHLTMEPEATEVVFTPPKSTPALGGIGNFRLFDERKLEQLHWRSWGVISGELTDRKWVKGKKNPTNLNLRCPVTNLRAFAVMTGTF